jgi:predicted RNA methylase
MSLRGTLPSTCSTSLGASAVTDAGCATAGCAAALALLGTVTDKATSSEQSALHVASAGVDRSCTDVLFDGRIDDACMERSPFRETVGLHFIVRLYP